MMKTRLIFDHERGLVLVIALVALLILSLAAAALIRSVDTATVIAGNLAFKQAATTSGEGALIGANKWLASNIEVGGKPKPILLGTASITSSTPDATIIANGKAVGYYSTVTFDFTTAVPPAGSLAAANGYVPSAAVTNTSFKMLTRDESWGATNSGKALVADCSGDYSDNKDCSDNQVRYVIERMCSLPGMASGSNAPANQQCIFASDPKDTDSKTDKDTPKISDLTVFGSVPMYRITVRSVGPKNSISYIQSFVY